MDSMMRELARVVYDPIAPINAFNAVPRFGHTSNITSIFAAGDGGGEELDSAALLDYIQGTVFVGGFCLASFIVWLLVLAICKCLGDKAGICAGRPFVEDKSQTAVPSRKPTIFKILMMVSSAIIVFNGLLFMFKGAYSVDNAFQDIDDATNTFMDVAGEIVKAADDTIAFGSDTVPLKEDIVVLIDDGICNMSGGGNGGGGSTIETEFNAQASAVVEKLNELQNFSKGSLVDLRDIFSADFDNLINMINKNIGTTETWVRPVFVAGPVVAFGFILLIGSYLAWNGPYIEMYFKIQTWVILPLFSILFIVVGIAISAVGTVLVVNSDICLGGDTRTPEGFITAILTSQQGIGENTMEAMNYYVLKGCESEFSLKNEVDDLLDNLRQVNDMLVDINISLDVDQETIENICGSAEGSLDSAKGSLIEAESKFKDFVSIADNASRAVECERINSIFIDIFHDALCTNGPYSLMWIFATMMPVFGLGMFMVLCRGALLPSDVIGEQESQRSHREDDAGLYNYDGDQGFYNDEIHPPTNNDTPVRDLSRGSRSVPQDKSNEMK
uniref:Uncharacterized protein n=1 Tax=Chaetoceros debilis TaxID=122233 RepID=A0A7S3VC74_9STRA